MQLERCRGGDGKRGAGILRSVRARRHRDTLSGWHDAAADIQTVSVGVDLEILILGGGLLEGSHIHVRHRGGGRDPAIVRRRGELSTGRTAGSGSRSSERQRCAGETDGQGSEQFLHRSIQ